MEQTEFTVRTTANSDIDVEAYLREMVSELENVNGVEAATVAVRSRERDISEVTRILDTLDEQEMNRLQDAIDSYTEGDDE